jgi:urease beta subunit
VAIPSGKTIRFKPGKDLQVSDEVVLAPGSDSED